MSDPLIDLSRALFAKTTLGQQEIQTRALRLSPITRRLLILIDGKRPAPELSPLVAGHDLNALLEDLLAKDCIAVATMLPTAPAAAVVSQTLAPDPANPLAAANAVELATLPDANTRSAKDIDMARHFMMNTINTVFPLNYQVKLLEAISACKTAHDVRQVYPQWSETIGSNKTGGKRLPEFRVMLFKVL